MGNVAHQSLRQAYQAFGGMTQVDVPWLIWLLENPESPVALAGAIALQDHDYLHILLNRGTTLEDEAFVIGFTMGNDTRMNRLQAWLFKLISHYFYPQGYRFTWQQFAAFDAGVKAGAQVPIKNLCRFDYSAIDGVNAEQLRSALKMTPFVL